MGHDTLGNMLETNFMMMHHHKYSLSDIENLLPWERQIYIGMLVNQLKEDKRQADEEAAKHR